MVEKKKPDEEDEEHVEPTPPSVVPAFQGIYRLVETLLMNVSLSKTAVERHDAAIAFLVESATVLAHLGEEAEAKSIWRFLRNYQTPRLRAMLASDEHGRDVMEVEEIGLRTVGFKHSVQPGDQRYLDRVAGQLASDAYVQKLSPVVSEVQALLISLGVLNVTSPRVEAFQFDLEEVDDGTAPGTDE